jgi:hypothetical protein
MARIFISYSHQDEAWKDRVVRQLKVLAGEGLETWDDRQIAAGDAWLPEIERALAGCEVALLLISAHFLTSQFILGQEVPALLQRREQQGIRVIPMIVSPCQWQRVSWLKPIQARPKDGKPLSGMSEHGAEEALSTLAGEIADLTAPSDLDPASGRPRVPVPAGHPAVAREQPSTAPPAPPPGRTVTAGNRGVAIGGSVAGSTIITGDHNVVGKPTGSLK